MDLIIIIVLIGVVAFVYRDVKFLVYLLGTLEVFFRLVHHIGDKLQLIDINPFVDKYIPTSTFAVLSRYTNGVVYEVFSWVLIIIYVMFLVYLVKYLIHKK